MTATTRSLRLMADAADGLRQRSLWARGIRTRLVRHAEGRLHVLDVPGVGDLPPVMFLHGLGSCAADEVRTILALRRLCRHVYAADLPAHGRSSPPADGRVTSGLSHLVAGLRAVTDEPVVLVGNSLGGFASVRLAHAAPERVAGLFLLAPGGAPLTVAEMAEVLRAFHGAGQTETLDFLDRTFIKPLWYRQVAALLIRGRAARPALSRAVAGADVDDLLLPEELSGLRIPVRVLWGELERLLPAHGHDFFAAHLPPGSVEVAPGIGHAPQHQNLRYTLGRLETFLRALPTPV